MPLTSKRTGPQPACLKRGSSPTYRAHQRRTELQTSRGLRRAWSPVGDAAKRRPDERLQGRGPDDRGHEGAKVLLGDRGYDANLFRNALTARGIEPCIPSKANRKIQITHNRSLYRKRHKIENMFGRLKDWRRIYTRYDRCAQTFMSAVCNAAFNDS